VPRRLTPAPSDQVVSALAAYDAGDATTAELKLLVKHHLALLQDKAPGNSVEVRIPPFAAIQCIAGVRHTRGTPPAVIETDADTWLALAKGRTSWADAVHSGRVRASGERTDISKYLPVG
jgi:hypothetical protein